ncbi:MAG: APC family permease [Bryobacteraceae bacterium]|nr:APC family permease [Bryobacteraceae bacterium]
MPIFGVVSQEARGHVVTALLIAMVAMLFTAVSYGRMARAYPSAGSAYTYVGNALHPTLGYVTGWSITLDYLLNPVISTIWCAKAAGNFFPAVPYPVFALGFAVLFTALNLRRVESSARTNRWLAYGLGAVVLVFLGYAVRYLLGQPLTSAALSRPFYDPATFAVGTLFTGTAVSVLTYIGFDGVSTLSEEVENPRRNVMRATVLVCLITGTLAALEVYAAQLIWPDFTSYPDVDTAFVHVAGRAGGPLLFALLNLALLVATIGSGSGAQMAAARLLFGMGRDNTIPKRFFAQLTANGTPRNSVLFSGALTLLCPLFLSYQLGVEMLNFGAFIAFMGVNLAAFRHYCLRQRDWSAANAVPPLLGFLVCFYIWANLNMGAKIAGAAWLAAGITYGAIRGTWNRTPGVAA